jgi:imidazolonepropionase-like amidohydrolase
MFYEAGGKLAMGTDAGTPFNRHGENSEELEYLVEVGVKPADALIAATRNAADLLDLPTQGRIAEGSAADLLVVTGDPTRDITAASRRENHRAVFKRGVRIV